MCNCSGECCVCACAGWCLAGNGDDDFTPASKEKIIARIDANEYERYREYMIKYLKEKYGFDYIKSKESEDKPTKHNVTISKSEERVIEGYWTLIAKKDSNIAEYSLKTQTTTNIGRKTLVVDKKDFKTSPTYKEIAQFLSDTGADFVSVEHNYRFEPDLPFC